MAKKFSELVKGDIIWEVSEKDGSVKQVLIFDSCNHTNKDEISLRMNHFKGGGSFSVGLLSPFRKKCYDSNVLKWFETANAYFTTERPQSVPTDGVGLYIHNKTHNPYEMISDHFMFKDVVGFNGDGGAVVYTWRRELVLYKALYECKDGPEFARHAEDFYGNFTRVR